MAPTIGPPVKEEAPPRKDILAQSSDQEDPKAPPDEVAPEPPTLEWFWGRYNLCLWKSLPPDEKARQVAFKELAEERARYQAACEAREATWEKEKLELWRRARRHADEVYEDGWYFARKTKGARRLIAAWRWADKLKHATDEDLWWAPNEMARSFARVHQQEADRHVKRCEAEEAENSLRAGMPPRTRELLARGYRNTGPIRRGY
jgi:hypothetical protein